MRRVVSPWGLPAFIGGLLLLAPGCNSDCPDNAETVGGRCVVTVRSDADVANAGKVAEAGGASGRARGPSGATGGTTANVGGAGNDSDAGVEVAGRGGSEPKTDAGAASECEPGFEPAAVGCSDIDECSGAAHGCEDTCQNTEGSYLCSCRGDDAILQADGKHCLSWHEPQQIDNPFATSAVSNFAIALDDAARGVASWARRDDSGLFVLYASRIKNGQWDAAVQLGTNVDAVDTPAVAVTPSGDPVVLWTEMREHILSRAWNGDAVGPQRQLDESSGGTSAEWAPRRGVNHPSLAIDRNGHGVAAWVEGSGQGYDIKALRYDNANWLPPATILDAGSGDANCPNVALDGKGTGSAVVVWQQFDGTAQYDLCASRFDGTSWTGGGPIETVAEELDWPSFYRNNAKLAVDGDGNALVAWVTEDSARTRHAWLSQLRPAASANWSSALRLANQADGDPIPVLHSLGSAFALWSEVDAAGSFGYFSQRAFSTGGELRTRIEIPEPGEHVVNHTAAFGPDGQALTVWLQTSGAQSPVGYSLWAARHKADSAIRSKVRVFASLQGKEPGFVQVKIDRESRVRVYWVADEAIWSAVYD